ncbi:MAG TPA: hypothetical protein DCM28_21485 [Phycisphaerales bacterium]|nr:hypothetical protein [Phycisphaerales bacterium]
MKSVKAVTVKDVAKAAGVSQAAVSMALRGSKEISAKRIEQIQKIAQKLNYYPQAAGQLLRSKRNNQIGVVISAPDTDSMAHSGFQSPLLGVMAAVCYKEQIAYQLEMHHCDSSNPSNLPHQIAANMVDGAILIGDVGQEMYDALAKRPTFPWVSINEPTPYSVFMDITGVTDRLLDHIHELGHRRVAYVGGPNRFLEHRLAMQTFERYSHTHQWDKHQKSDWTHCFESQENESHAAQVQQWALKVLGSDNRPSAVVCHGDPQARSVAHVAAGLGLVIGKDLSITSWGSRVDAMKTWPNMTAVVYDHEQLVVAALDMLKRRIRDPETIKPHVQIVNASLYFGSSTGPVSS